jgi:fructokinase
MILSCGEALIDMLPRESSVGEDCFAPYAGGAVFNTAIALGRLGIPSGFFSGLSQDLFGEMLEAALAASNVSTDLVVRSDRPTTLAFVRLLNGHASYAFYDENTAGRMIDPDQLPDLPDSVQAMFFGGISLVVEPCAQAYEALMMREATTRVTMIDPNIRPDFIKDEPTFRARIGRMIAAADIVKLSDEDLEWLEGPGAIGDQVAAILERGPKLVCITRGADGVTGYTKTFGVTVTATRVDVVDTVGAGDTFNAGLQAALHDAGTLTKSGIAQLTETHVKKALHLGSRAAAITVSRAGANPPWREEL